MSGSSTFRSGLPSRGQLFASSGYSSAQRGQTRTGGSYLFGKRDRKAERQLPSAASAPASVGAGVRGSRIGGAGIGGPGVPRSGVRRSGVRQFRCRPSRYPPAPVSLGIRVVIRRV